MGPFLAVLPILGFLSGHGKSVAPEEASEAASFGQTHVFVSIKLVSAGSHVFEEVPASRATWGGSRDTEVRDKGKCSTLLEENLSECFAGQQDLPAWERFF